ncbi:MAG: dockerin type I domain-containing protein, partial [Saprospiraceae bacterium]
ASSKRWNAYTPNKICGVQANGASTDITDPNVYINYGLKVLETTSCDGPTETELRNGRPHYVQGPCDVIGVNTAVERYDFEDGVCRKWVVTYTFMNWCNNYCVRFKQDWIFRDVIAPVIDCAPRAIFQQQANCTTGITLKKSATDLGGCTVAAPAISAWLKWEVFVDVWADGTWDYAYSSFVASTTANGGFAPTTYGGISSSTNPAGSIPTKYIPATSNGINAKIDFKDPIAGKYSKHKVLWRVYDGCHNATQCEEVIEVKDLKPPTPYCIHLSTALMQVPVGAPAGSAPMVEIWARDFDRGSTDFCTAQQDLKFTFNNWLPNADRIYSEHYFDAAGKGYDITASNTIKYNAGEYQRWLPSQKSSSMIFTKANLPGVTLKMSVIDWNNNVDYCSVDLRLVCNDPINCPPGSATRIAGNVHTESGQGVMNVDIVTTSNLPENPTIYKTDNKGNYGLEIYTDTELSAHKNDDVMNGVSTLDLVMIQRHILGIEPITSPYKLIAADANHDGQVTASDLTEIIQLVLGTTKEYPNNYSWRFPIEDQVMSVDRPFPYLESMIAHTGPGDGNYNFIAVKIGDVSGNAAGSVMNPVSEARSSKVVVLGMEDQILKAGEEAELAVMAGNFSDIAGFQYTMNLKGANYVGIRPGALEMTRANVGLISKDEVTMSYAGKQGITLGEGTVLYTIIVKADRAVKVSEMLSIGSAVTPAESYTSDFAVG